MNNEQSQKTQELIARLKRLRESKKESAEGLEPDGLSKVARQIDEEILKVSKELQELKTGEEDGDSLELKEADALVDELLGDSKKEEA